MEFSNLRLKNSIDGNKHKLQVNFHILVIGITSQSPSKFARAFHFFPHLLFSFSIINL